MIWCKTHSMLARDRLKFFWQNIEILNHLSAEKYASQYHDALE